MRPNRTRFPHLILGLLASWFCLFTLPADAGAAEQPALVAAQSDSLEYTRVWEAILAEAGLTPEMVALPTMEKRRLFVAGKIHLDCCAAPIWRDVPEERSVQLFTDIIADSPEYYVFRAGQAVRITDAGVLGTLRFAVVRGFTYDGIDRFGSVLAVRDMDEMLEAVATGQADTGIININDFNRRMRAHAWPLELGDIHYIADLRARVHRDHAALVPRLNAAIARLKSSGRIRSILSDRSADNIRVRVGQSDSVGFQAAWRAILQEAGIDPEYVVAPHERKRRLFVDGALLMDCCAAPIWRTRPDEVAIQIWSDTFYVTREQFVFARGRVVDVSTPEALARLRVAVVRGFDYLDQDKFGARIPGRDVADVLKLIEAGRADTGIISNVDFHMLVKDQPDRFVLGPVRVAAEQKVRLHVNAGGLVARINDAIARLKADGTLVRLLEGEAGAN